MSQQEDATASSEALHHVSDAKQRPQPASATTRAAASCDELLLGRVLAPDTGLAVPYFHQVLTYVGPVEPHRLEMSLQSLFRVFAARKVGRDGRRVVLYAVDGTLLNLLRWGLIVNDNDLDIGFHVEGVPLNDTMEHYYTLLRVLAVEGLIAPVTERDERRLHSSSGSVKKGKCKHRGQLMQCVLLGSGVMIDFFGPETMYSETRTQLTPQDVEPIVHCRAFGAEFPCPYHFERVLKRFTLDMRAPGAVGEGGGGGGGGTWYEFEGCALFPRRDDEHSENHLRSILRSLLALDVCGYPTLGFELSNPTCAAVARTANVTLLPTGR